MRWIPLLVGALPLVGCSQGMHPFGWGASGDDTGEALDSGAAPQRLEGAIDRVVPAWGSTLGGEEVHILGGPFDDTAEVLFTGAGVLMQATVLSATSTQLTVLTPSWAEEVSLTSVEVKTDTHRAVAPDAFRYFEDGAGLTGMLGALERFERLGEVEAGAARTWARAQALFTRPTVLDWGKYRYAPGVDQCRVGYEGPPDGEPLQVYETELSSLELSSSAGGSVHLAVDPGASWRFAAEPDPSAFVHGSTYHLEPTAGSAGVWPEVSLDALFVSPNPLSLYSPYLDSTYPPSIGRDWFMLSWDTSDPADYVVADLRRYHGDTLVETVTCKLADDGSFTVPPTAWTGWDTGSALSIRIGRVSEGTATLPYNGARAGVVGISWVVGTGAQQ
ncbi:MAG: IPT/TIG domain-containing protein [Deltaproteobacteria bacterium]|nr:IPT/TIG domain-containing protein [Deltaproteobacteria bacterium]